MAPTSIFQVSVEQFPHLLYAISIWIDLNTAFILHSRHARGFIVDSFEPGKFSCILKHLLIFC